MKISVNWNVGNFDVTAETEVTEELTKVFLEKGALQMLQRQSGIDKVLGIVVKDGDKTKRLPIKRNEVAYSDGIALNLAEALTSVEIDENRKVRFAVSVAEYEPTTKAIKFAFEKSLLSEKVAGGKTLAEIAKTIGYAGATGEAPDYTTEFLSVVKAYLDALRKSGI